LRMPSATMFSHTPVFVLPVQSGGGVVCAATGAAGAVSASDPARAVAIRAIKGRRSGVVDIRGRFRPVIACGESHRNSDPPEPAYAGEPCGWNAEMAGGS